MESAGLKMKAFVTGATGFVGSHLVRVLQDRGFEVVCLARPSSRLDNLSNLPVEIRKGDIRDPSSLLSAMKGCHVAYHCAADYRLWCPDPGQMEAINIEGTRNIMETAYSLGVERVVYTSTVGCLGLNRDGPPADESTPVSLRQMIGHYKRTKFLAEREAERWIQKGLPVVIVNPSTPVGDYDVKPTPTGKIIVDFLRGKMFGYVDTGMNLIDVRDVAEGHLLAAERGRIGEKYILGHQNLLLKEIFDRLSRLTGIPSPRFHVPAWLAVAFAHLDTFWTGQIRHREPLAPLEGARMSRYKMWFDSSKAQRELGLPQSPVDGALARAVTWFREYGYIR
jgi:dihydroflavonol-4-reductase